MLYCIIECILILVTFLAIKVQNCSYSRRKMANLTSAYVTSDCFYELPLSVSNALSRLWHLLHMHLNAGSP